MTVYRPADCSRQLDHSAAGPVLAERTDSDRSPVAVGSPAEAATAAAAAAAAAEAAVLAAPGKHSTMQHSYKKHNTNPRKNPIKPKVSSIVIARVHREQTISMNGNTMRKLLSRREHFDGDIVQICQSLLW